LERYDGGVRRFVILDGKTRNGSRVMRNFHLEAWWMGVERREIGRKKRM